jgi:hypothetical protein
MYDTWWVYAGFEHSVAKFVTDSIFRIPTPLPEVGMILGLGVAHPSTSSPASCKEMGITGIVALAEWLRRVPAKYMGFPRKSSNLLGDGKMNIAATFLFQSSKSYFTVFVLLKNSE